MQALAHGSGLPIDCAPIGEAPSHMTTCNQAPCATFMMDHLRMPQREASTAQKKVQSTVGTGVPGRALQYIFPSQCDPMLRGHLRRPLLTKSEAV